MSGSARERAEALLTRSRAFARGRAASPPSSRSGEVRVPTPLRARPRHGRLPGTAAAADAIPLDLTRPPKPPLPRPSTVVAPEHFFCNNFPEFATRARAARGRLGALLARLGADAADVDPSDADAATRCDEDDAAFRDVKSVLEDHFDRADSNLDALVSEGRASQPGGAGPSRVPALIPSTAGQAPRQRGAPPPFFSSRVPEIVSNKPQSRFEDPVDTSDAPFLPPEPWSFGRSEQSVDTDASNGASNGFSKRETRVYVAKEGAHPLRAVVETMAYPARALLAPETPTPPDPDPPPPVFVDTDSALADLALDLEKVDEFAVDLEHHSYRSFFGFTCLMQISTRAKDYVVDALALRSRIRARLARHFEDPTKMKVFHGADMDVQWLQRDFGVYVVCMFDTGRAATRLAMPKKSLAFLLQHYCGVAADKTFQLADWRARPLSDEMLAYARGDTRHLLYVCDRMRQQLAELSPGAVRDAFDASAKTCLKLYAPPRAPKHAPDAWREEYFKLPADRRDLDRPAQFAAFRAAHAWRDRVAREADESLGYVAPRHALLALARAAPTDRASVLAACRGFSSAIVAARAQDLADAIAEAVKRAEENGEFAEEGVVNDDDVGWEHREGGGIESGVRREDVSKTASSAQDIRTTPPPASSKPAAAAEPASVFSTAPRRGSMAAAFANEPPSVATPSNARTPFDGSAMARVLSGVAGAVGIPPRNRSPPPTLFGRARGGGRRVASARRSPRRSFPSRKSSPSGPGRGRGARERRNARPSIRSAAAGRRRGVSAARAVGGDRFENAAGSGPAAVTLPGGYSAPAPLRAGASASARPRARRGGSRGGDEAPRGGGAGGVANAARGGGGGGLFGGGGGAQGGSDDSDAAIGRPRRGRAGARSRRRGRVRLRRRRGGGGRPAARRRSRRWAPARVSEGGGRGGRATKRTTKRTRRLNLRRTRRTSGGGSGRRRAGSSTRTGGCSSSSRSSRGRSRARSRARAIARRRSGDARRRGVHITPRA